MERRGLREGASALRSAEQLPATLRLGIGLVPDLVPNRVRAVRVRAALGHDSLEIEPLRGPQHVAAAPLHREHLAQRRTGGLHEPLEHALATGKRQRAQISPVHPERIERSVMKVATPGQQSAEILPALRIERHHLTVQDRLLDRKLLTDPVAEILESAEHVAALGAKVTGATGYVKEAAEPVVLGLENPGGVVERPLQTLWNARLNQRQNRRGPAWHAQVWRCPDLRRVRAGGPIGEA